MVILVMYDYKQTNLNIEQIFAMLELLLLLQPFNGLFSRTTWVSRYQKGKTNLDFTGARDSEWQWHQLDHMLVCTSLQTDNHASTPPLFFTGRMPFLSPNQQCQKNEGTKALKACHAGIEPKTESVICSQSTH